MIANQRMAVVVGIICALACVALQHACADTNDRIKFDNQCLTIDGHDMVIFSGAFHYFRCPEPLWADRFRKLKEAGFNTVETYVAWNYAEPNPPAGTDDFSKLDLTDLDHWLAMATDQFGLNVIIRPGPYICAEWDGGGYPQWLGTKKPADFPQGKEWFRSDDPTYLAWSKHWYSAVAKVAAPYQITHRPAGKAGIILWQIENEYDYSDQPVPVKKAQLDFLAHAARDLGIDVPLTTCMTDNAAFKRDDFLSQNVIETRNTYPKFSMSAMRRDIGMLATYQPNKFRMVTELQGGWFSQVGGELSEAQGFDASHINHVTLFAWENGFTVTNYYMGFGGTNFGDWAADRITTSYDYDAPLRECGGVTERYFAVKALGQFIAEHAASLSRTTADHFDVVQKTDSSVVITVRKAQDGSRYVFVRTEQRQGTHKGTFTLKTAAPDSMQITGSYELGPYGSMVLYLPPGATSDSAGQWYPKHVDPPARPSQLPEAVAITEVRMKDDPGPTDWKPFSAAQSEEDAGIYNRGFVYYRTTLADAPAAGESRALSFFTHGSDWAGFELNGKPLTNNPAFGTALVLDSFQPGAELVGLYENAGRANFGETVGEPCGIFNLKISPWTGEPRRLEAWRAKFEPRGSDHAIDTTDATNDSTWETADVDTNQDGPLQPGENAVYRAWVTLSADDLKNGKTLVLGRVDDEGWIFVNGHVAGDCHDWSHAQQFDIGQWLHPGKNLVAVYVHNIDNSGGLTRKASLINTSPAIPTPWQISDRPTGLAEKWFASDLDDSRWQKTDLHPGASATTSSNALITWYRMKFSLPSPDPHAWIPWKVRLDAVGNGFIYLNNRPLGRWWQVGPQRDFYLPECWLNFGPDQSNSLVLSLRPTADGDGIRSAHVGPYANMAEVR